MKSKNVLWLMFACVCGMGFAADHFYYLFLTAHGMRLPLLLLLFVAETLLGIAAFRMSGRKVLATAALFAGLAIGNWWLLELLLVGIIWRTRGFAP